MQDEVKRVDNPGDTRRCQGVTAMGQCQQLQVPGTIYCKMHGGVGEARKIEKKNIDMYRLGEYQSRVAELKDHQEVKGLRSEIGILRMTLESIIKRCESPTQLALSAGLISDLVVKIDKLVNSAHKLEGQLGLLLDKQQLLKFVEAVNKVLLQELADLDPQRLARLSIAILTIAEGIGQPDEDEVIESQSVPGTPILDGLPEDEE